MEWVIPGIILLAGIIWIASAKADPERSVPVTGMTDPGAAVDEFYSVPELRQGETVSRREICNKTGKAGADLRGNAFAADVEKELEGK